MKPPIEWWSFFDWALNGFLRKPSAASRECRGLFCFIAYGKKLNWWPEVESYGQATCTDTGIFNPINKV